MLSRTAKSATEDAGVGLARGAEYDRASPRAHHQTIRVPEPHVYGDAGVAFRPDQLERRARQQGIVKGKARRHPGVLHREVAKAEEFILKRSRH